MQISTDKVLPYDGKGLQWCFVRLGDVYTRRFPEIEPMIK